MPSFDQSILNTYSIHIVIISLYTLPKLYIKFEVGVLYECMTVSVPSYQARWIWNGSR